MTIREWVNKNSAAVTVGVILVLLVALGFIIKSSVGGGAGEAKPKWFYCLETQQLFGADISSISPIESPWGGEGVEAIVYFCGNCKGEPQIAYLTKYNPEMKGVIEQLATQPKGESVSMPSIMDQMGGTLVSKPENIDWFSVISQQGSKIKSTPFDCGEEDDIRIDCPPR